MTASVLLLLLINFLAIGALPRVFFRKDGSLNARWWMTALPFFGVPVFLAFAFAARWVPTLPGGWTPVLQLVAVPLSASSIALTFLTVGTHRTPIALWHQENDAPGSIVTHGAYRWIRHPFYASFIAAFLAGAAAFPHPVTIGCLAYGVIGLDITARREEKRLSASEFGSEYRRYMQRTGRFLPRPGVG
ncbi:isoprenylcysteine carboxylmethyltransferase family protein [Streptomyces sp. NPDC051776]|uniref:methyltransferase family protein n=1 Tax=Streptomyces sp. NPDC051776 TaxID=3155414 RepID=UPI003431FA2B